MLRLRRALLVFSATLALSAIACAQKTEPEVRKVYARMNTLIAKNDVNGLVALFEKTSAPDFKATMGKRSIGRKRFVDDLKKGLSMKNAPKGVSKVLSSKKVGQSLVLNIQWTISGKSPEGKPYSMKMTSINTWVPTAGGYRLKRVDEHMN